MSTFSGLLVFSAALVSVGPARAAQDLIAWRSARADSAWNRENFVALGRGHEQSLALRADGSLIAFGRDTNGECSAIPALPPGVQYVAASGGRGHALALRSDGLVAAWGASNRGQTSVPALPPGLAYTAVAAAEEHSLVLRSDGQVLGFGSNFSGERTVPALPGGQTYTAIACGGVLTDDFEPLQLSFSLALRSDGALLAFGDNDFGQLAVPTLPVGLTYVACSAGAGHALAVRSDGEAVAWGDNSFGQCNVPALPPGLAYVSAAAGGDHSALLRSDGALIAFGSTLHGATTVPPLPPGVVYSEIWAGGRHTLALRSDGRHVAFGDNDWQQCNAPEVPAGRTVEELARGRDFTLARLDDGTLLYWGSARSPVRNLPSAPIGTLFVEVAAGDSHALARRDDGAVVAWGQAGAHTVVPQLPPGTSWVEIAASPARSLARRSDGVLVAFDGTSTGAEEAPALPAGTSWIEIASGGLTSPFLTRHFSAALRSDGAVLVWGDLSGALPALAGGARYLGIGASTGAVVARTSDGGAVHSNATACPLPTPPVGQSYTAVAAHGVLAARSDGVLIDCNGETAPPLAPGLAYGAFASGQHHVATYGPASAALAPALAAAIPASVPALAPGSARTLALEGAGFEHLTELCFAGSALSAARFQVVSPALIRVDLPQTATLGVHLLEAVGALGTSSLALEVVALETPALELGTGEPGNVVDRDDGLRYVVAGPPGSLQRLFGSPSNLPSVSPWVTLALGNQFSALLRGPQHVIPPAGWLEVLVPTSALGDPGPTGTTYFSQSVELVFPAPLAVSNLQSILLVR